MTRGIPGIFLIAGNAPTPDGKNAREINRRWAREHLHRPSDDLDQPFEDRHLVKWAELFRRWTLDIAIEPSPAHMPLAVVSQCFALFGWCAPQWVRRELSTLVDTAAT